MNKTICALVFGLAAGAAVADAADADTVYSYDSNSGRMVMHSAPDAGGFYRGGPVMQAPAPQVYYHSPAPDYRYVPPGLSITTPLGTYAPFYGGWSPYSHENVGGYDHYRMTPDR